MTFSSWDDHIIYTWLLNYGLGCTEERDLNHESSHLSNIEYLFSESFYAIFYLVLLK